MSKKSKKSKKSEKINSVDPLGSVMDFWIVSYINNKDSGLNRIAAMYKTDVECRQHHDAMRCWMKAPAQDSIHMFPEEWTVVYDHYKSGVICTGDSRYVPVTTFKVEEK